MDTRLPLDQHVDILAIGAHPKDVEIGVGGILLKMAHRGCTTVICDLTKGEMDDSASSSLEELALETEEAAKILHVADRVNLDLGDSQLNPSMDQAQALAEYIRVYRPDIILAPYWEDWHPDLCVVGQLVKKAVHLARLYKVDKSHKPYAPAWLFYYTLNKPTIPQIVVNVTSTFEGKIQAIKVYQAKSKEIISQSFPSSSSYRDYLFHIESRARHFGSLINCRFGEGLIIDKPIPVDDICEFANL